MNVPELDKVNKIIQEWASKNGRISKVYLFGSYVTKRKIPPGDIDVAIEISNEENDTAFGFWCGESEKMESELSQLLEYKVPLEWHDTLSYKTPTIEKGLNEGSYMIYQNEIPSQRACLDSRFRGNDMIGRI